MKVMRKVMLVEARVRELEGENATRSIGGGNTIKEWLCAETQ